MRTWAARRRAFGAPAVLLSLSLFAAEWSTLVHHLTTRHEVCPEHGHVVDVRVGHHPVHGVEGEPTDRAALRESPAFGDAHEHHHCGVSLLSTVAALGVVDDEAPADLSLAVAEASSSRSLGSIPLLLLAPKCSPPAAA